MTSHTEKGLELLHSAWSDANGDVNFELDDAFAALVDEVFAGTETGYKKAIIIQAAGKAADPALDAQAMQKGDGSENSWDAREFAKQTFVKWNKDAKEPFTHSGDPYVSNPYRIPRFDESQRAQRQKKSEFDRALLVLQHLNATDQADKAYSNLVEILIGLKRWIADKDVNYPLPKRASLIETMKATDSFLLVKSGGTRLQAVVAALFQTLASAGLQIVDIASGHVNSADSSAKKAGDVTFQTDSSSFAAEVKDRSLNEAEVTASINKARIAGASDLMFIVRASSPFENGFDPATFEEICASQFSSGLNIYLEKFENFSRVCLSLVGEDGRRTYLEEVGNSLSSQKADISHKWAWSDIVKAL
jgi:SacI restriction endonuclease